ncbi:class 1 fructose-bisphosphatase [uncultured Rhodoblastus sp.]|uniref:class 1 fructose-bisphosphatase n=1 Tax=uncultured Rhodoblastus sp. TaxID=543037 RepID=UPI0025F2AE76|nr:class 1 fructose-bisphosphatase [uncultured Rhodoblastus sp.]
MGAQTAPALQAKDDGLAFFLANWAGADIGRGALARCIGAMAQAGGEIARLVAAESLAGQLGADVGQTNQDGDDQKRLDLIADRMILDALRKTPVAFYASEESEAILTLDPQGALAVACDPIDGSANIELNLAIATIFAVFPVAAEGATASFLRRGADQVAAGYILYGPHTALILTLGSGVAQFILDPAANAFRRSGGDLSPPAATLVFAINASNYRHWPDPIRDFIDECVRGGNGPKGKDFNMRWLACVAAEAHRILRRGGVYLYPSDRRKGYENGRLRLLYEAFPIAFLIEQAGGAATDGVARLLDKTTASLHQRSALVFGSTELVARVAACFKGAQAKTESAPPSGQRGLLQN